MARESYFDTITAAINDIAANGYDSADRIAYWSKKIREAAERQMAPEFEMEQMLRDAMAAVYKRLVDSGGALKYHSGVARFTLDKVRPQLRAELDRRIMASAQLIKLNRKQAIEKTLQRFQGWSTSIPAGGSENVERKAEKDTLRKALASLPFEERRVLTDQGHKLSASISEVLARDGQAVAVKWNSHWRQPGYHYRVDHKERDGQVYMLRGNWAQGQGLAKAGPAGFYEDVTAFAEEPFCRCFGTYLYTLRDVPEDMVTQKGATALTEARAKIAAM